MSMSFTVSGTETYSLAHARRIASKVATDLKRIQDFYKKPTDTWIDWYELEATMLLKEGLLQEVRYGFKRDGRWIEPTLIYTARDLSGSHSNDDDPGRIRPKANIKNASFTSFLEYSAKWRGLSETDKRLFKEKLPFSRSYGNHSPIDGVEIADRSYSAGGRALDRRSVRSR